MISKFIHYLKGVSTGCSMNTCKNDGVCIEKWEDNQQVCNCEMTTFTGDNCELGKS